jgi:hypothetical protein
MRRFCLVMIVAILGCAMAGCGGAQQPPPPTDLSKAPPDPFAGVPIHKKGSHLKQGRSLPPPPPLAGPGTPK